jgi:drug/metabolite transporter (DMT)-like permease
MAGLEKMARDMGESYIPAMQSPGVSVGRATALIVISAISFGSISVLTLLTTGAGLPLLTVMAWRYVLGALLLIPSARTLVNRSVSKRQIVQLLLIGGFGQALITYLSLYSLRYIPVGPLAFLFYTYPAWVAVIAAVRRTERLTPIRATALALALIGVTVMVGAPVERLNPIGVALALGSALLYSVYLPALEYVQEGVPAMPATFVLILGAAVSFLVAMVLAREAFIPQGLAVWTNIALLAAVSTVIAFSALIKGLSVLGPVRTAIIATVEPFFTAILGVLVLGNHMGLATITGGVFIATAILVIEWSSTGKATATA